jgi:hypothetical protein
MSLFQIEGAGGHHDIVVSWVIHARFFVTVLTCDEPLPDRRGLKKDPAEAGF